MIRILIVFFVSLASAGVSFAELPVSKENFHLYLLVGQSNMAGRGKVTKEDKESHPRILMLSKDKKWVPAVDPLHFDKPIAGVGLGRTFAMEIAADDPEIVIGLIPCAVGGSPIDAWEPGGYHASTKTHPWDDMLPRAKKAMEEGTLKGILWHQGESDSKEGLAPSYEKKLHALVARFRKALEAPGVPFLAGAMGNWPERPWDKWKKMVDAAHRSLPEKVDHTAFVSADGLSHRDKVHFDRASYLELGKRYAEAYRGLRKGDQ